MSVLKEGSSHTTFGVAERYQLLRWQQVVESFRGNEEILTDEQRQLAILYYSAVLGDQDAVELAKEEDIGMGQKLAARAYFDVIVGRYRAIFGIEITDENRTQLAERAARMRFTYYVGRFPKHPEMTEITDWAESNVAKLDKMRKLSATDVA